MKSVCKRKEIEYRDYRGIDQTITIDMWLTDSKARAVLVLYDLPTALTGGENSQPSQSCLQQVKSALNVLHQSWLPYFLTPDTRLSVMLAHNSGVARDIEVTDRQLAVLASCEPTTDSALAQQSQSAYAYAQEEIQLMALSA